MLKLSISYEAGKIVLGGKGRAPSQAPHGPPMPTSAPPPMALVGHVPLRDLPHATHLNTTRNMLCRMCIVHLYIEIYCLVLSTRTLLLLASLAN